MALVAIEVLALALGLIVLDLALASTLSFDALTCDTWASCAELYMTCQGAYLCASDACDVVQCFGAPDTGPRHGRGFVWLLGSILALLYTLRLVRRVERQRTAQDEVDIDLDC